MTTKYSVAFTSKIASVLASLCVARESAESAIKAEQARYDAAVKAGDTSAVKADIDRVPVTTEVVAGIVGLALGVVVEPAEVAGTIKSGEVPGYGFVKGPYGGIVPVDKIVASQASKDGHKAQLEAAKIEREAAKAAKIAAAKVATEAAKAAKKAEREAAKAAPKAAVKTEKAPIDIAALAALCKDTEQQQAVNG